MPPKKTRGKAPVITPPAGAVQLPAPAPPPPPPPPAQPENLQPQPPAAHAPAPSRGVAATTAEVDDIRRLPSITERAHAQPPAPGLAQPPRQQPRTVPVAAANKGPARAPEAVQQRSFLQAAAEGKSVLPQRAIVTRSAMLTALGLTGPRYTDADCLRKLGPPLDDTIEQLDMLRDCIDSYCLNEDDSAAAASTMIPSIIRDSAACLAREDAPRLFTALFSTPGLTLLKHETWTPAA